MTLVDLRHDAADAADDRVLHDGRLWRQPVAAARRRTAGAASSSSSRPSLPIAQNVLGVVRRRRARSASADGRARRVRDAHRRTRDRPGVCARCSSSAGVPGAATLAVAVGDGRHRRRRADGRAHWHLAHGAATARDRTRSPAHARRAGCGDSTSARTWSPSRRPTAPKGEDVEAYGLLKTLVVILVAMWIGAWVSAWIQGNVRFPWFIPGVGGSR